MRHAVDVYFNHTIFFLIHWTKKWICSNLRMRKDVVNMIVNLVKTIFTHVHTYGTYVHTVFTMFTH